MTVIALLDTESLDDDKGLIDCMVGLPEAGRAPQLRDFVVRVSGTGAAEVIGVTPLAGQRRNAWRLTIRLSGETGLLCVRYRPEKTAKHGKKQGAGIDVTVMGGGCRAMLDAGGDEWHLPLSAVVAAPRADAGVAAEPGRTEGRAAAPAAAGSRLEPPMQTALPDARVLPMQRPAAKLAPPPPSRPEDQPAGPEPLPGLAASSLTVLPRK